MASTLCLLLLPLSFIFDKSSALEVKQFRRPHAVAFKGVRPCDADWCDPSHEPYPNIVAVMTGYNLLRGNPFPSDSMFDQGFSTSYIFKPTYMTEQGRYALYEGIGVRANVQCSLQMDTTYISAVDGYLDTVMSKASSGVDFASNLETEVSAEIKGIGIKTDVPPLLTAAFGSSRETEDGESFFTRNQGMLTMNEATCTSYSVKLSNYNPPPFTDAMITALQRLQNVLTETAKQRHEVIMFIEEFGTHFQEEVMMGARMGMTRKYSLDEYKGSTHAQINECNKKSFNALVFGAQIGAAKESCNKVAQSTSTEKVQGHDRVKLFSYGSVTYGSLLDWSHQKFVAPLPIKMKLSPILNLFTKAHMKPHPEIDYKRILKMMAPIYYQYCADNEHVVGVCQLHSSKGCGWNDKCIRGQQVCVNKPSTKDGYFCCKPTCPTNPCKNGGTCKEYTSSCTYRCSCKRGYKGAHCEQRYVISDDVKADLLRKMASNTKTKHYDFAKMMVNYYKSKYPLYDFNVVSYKPVTGFQYHTVTGSAKIFVFRNYGRSAIVAWALKSSTKPNTATRNNLVASISGSSFPDKDCNAEKSFNIAKEKLRRSGLRYSMLMACREKSCKADMSTSDYGRAVMFDAGKKKKIFGITKCFSRFFIMFGNQ